MNGARRVVSIRIRSCLAQRTLSPADALREQPLVLRAFEELKMLAQTEVERERYEARRKAQLDYNTGLRVARMEGREQGRVEGRAEAAIDRIHLCERLLKRPLTPTEELLRRSLDDLMKLADDLQAQVLTSE
jgi:hypothetical protein